MVVVEIEELYINHRGDDGRHDNLKQGTSIGLYSEREGRGFN